MSQQQMQLPLGVRNIDLDKKSNLILNKTRLICDNLNAKILVDSPWAKTEGKAYLIGQEPLTSELTKSSVLQETTDGQMVVMDTVHPSNEDVAKQFQRVRRTTQDLKIVMYPMYILMIIMTILYSLLIYKTGVQKEPIIVESSQWMDIFLVTMIFILSEGLVYYWIYTQYIEKTVFKSYTLPKVRTYEVRHEGRAQSISATYFKGFFFTLDTATSKKIWGNTVSEYEDYLKDEDGVSFTKKINDLIGEKHIHERKIVDAYKIYEMKKDEIQKLEYRLSADFRSQSEEFMKESEINEKIDNDPDVIKKREELDKIKENYLEVREVNYSKWEDINETIEKTQNKYQIRLNKILGDSKDQRVREMLTNTEKYMSKLNHDVSMMRSKIIGLTNLITSAYNESLIVSDHIMEHVYSILHEEGARKYEIGYTLKNQQGQAVQQYNGNGNGQSNGSYSNPQYQDQNQSGGVKLDMTPILKILFVVLGVLSVIYGIGWAIPKILGAFGGLTGLGVAAMFIFLVTIIAAFWGIFRMVNMFSDSANNRTSIGFK